MRYCNLNAPTPAAEADQKHSSYRSAEALRRPRSACVPTENVLFQQILKGRAQLAKTELVSAGSELSGLNPLASEQHFVSRRSAESQSQRKLRHRKNRRTSQHGRQDLCELRIPHRVRRHQIHWPRQRLRADRVMDRSYDVVDMNPAPPLLSRSNSATQP